MNTNVFLSSILEFFGGLAESHESCPHNLHTHHYEISPPEFTNHFPYKRAAEDYADGVYCEDVAYPMLVNLLPFKLKWEERCNYGEGCIRDRCDSKDRYNLPIYQTAFDLLS